MIKDLIKIATSLDQKGLLQEADYLDKIINKIAAEPSYEMDVNPDWDWTDDFHDPNDEGYNDPEGLLETGESQRSLSDPDLLSDEAGVWGMGLQGPGGKHTKWLDDYSDDLSKETLDLLDDYIEQAFRSVDTDRSNTLTKDEILEAFGKVIEETVNELNLSKEDTEDYIQDILKKTVDTDDKFFTSFVDRLLEWDDISKNPHDISMEDLHWPK